ncbi:MAG: hypothetical protein QXI58_01165 [Candidatus Micrarchaeia archaeon]
MKEELEKLLKELTKTVNTINECTITLKELCDEINYFRTHMCYVESFKEVINAVKPKILRKEKDADNRA